MSFDFQAFVTAVANGELDSHLDDISPIVSARRSISMKLQAASANIGDTVRITRLRPKRFDGYTGTLVRREGDRYVVKLNLKSYDAYDRTVQRYVRNTDEIHLPSGTFEVVR